MGRLLDLIAPIAPASNALPCEAAKEVSVVAQSGCEKSEEYNQEYFFRRFARQSAKIDAVIGGFLAAIVRAFDLPPGALAIRPAPPFPTTPERLPPVHWLATSYRRDPPPICTCCSGTSWRALTRRGADPRAWACTTCRPGGSPGSSEQQGDGA
jgi:hypothetical protein